MAISIMNRVCYIKKKIQVKINDHGDFFFRNNEKLWKRSKFDHTEKCYMHKLESVQENATQKILWDFKIKMDHFILARRIHLKVKFSVVLVVFFLLS